MAGPHSQWTATTCEYIPAFLYSASQSNSLLAQNCTLDPKADYFRLINLVLLIQMSRLRIDLVFPKFIKGNMHANNPRIRFGACDERCKRRYRRLFYLSVSEGKVRYRKIIIKTSFQNLEWKMDWTWPLQSRTLLLANQLRSQTTDIGEQGLWAGAPEALSSAKG